MNYTKNSKFNFLFCFASFKVDEQINRPVIYSYLTERQVYSKMNMAFHPTQTTKENSNRHSMPDVFLCFENALNKKVERLANS